MRFTIPVLLLAGVLTLAACHPAKKLAVQKPLSDIRPEQLTEKMDSASFRFQWLSAKISAASEADGKSNSFTVSLRLRRDSLMWLSISALGIEAARVLITPDTIKLLDRLNSKYLVTDFTYLNEMLQLSADFSMLQALLVGNYFPYIDARKLRSSYIDDNLYILSTLRKRKLKRALEEKEPNKRIIQDFWLNPSSFRIEKLAVDDNKLKKKLVASYDEFQPTEGGAELAHKSKFTIESVKPATLELEFSKVTVDKPLEFPFSIPEKYEPMK